MSLVGKAHNQRPERIELILDQLEQLPTLPVVAVRVLQATTSDQSCAGDVVEIISSDQSLAARIISLARSASLGVPRSVETVDSAVALLGFDAVRHAVLSIKVFETLNVVKQRSSTYFDAAALWKHVLAVGCASHLIAGRWPGHIDPEVAFVCGLLHDIGKVALAACLPKSYDRVVGLAISRGVSILAAEQEILGVDHTVAGKRLAQRWNLPAGVTECIWLHHHSPDMLPEGIANPDLVQIVNVADVWVAEQRLGAWRQAACGPSSQEIARQLCLPIEHLSECAKRLPDMVAHRAAMLGLDGLTSGEIFADVVAQANAELGRLAGECVAAKRHADQGSRTLRCLREFQAATRANASLSGICLAAGKQLRELADLENVAVFCNHDPDDVWHLAVAGGNHDHTEVFVGRCGDWNAGQDLPPAGMSRLMAPLKSVVPVVERCRGRLGPAPYWMLPVIDNGAMCGGILFAADAGGRARIEALGESLTAVVDSLAHALGSTYDRHHIERLNESLAQVNLRLKASQEELVRARSLEFVAEMAGGAAHELNNPLAVISGRAELLARRTGDERIKKGLEIIVAQAHRCSGIVNELMEFAKPATPQIERVTLADVIEDEVGEWVEGVSLPRDRLEVVISDRDISIDVDASQIRKALREVLDNAYAACDPEEAFLKVNCSPDTTDEVAVIVVQDNGQGMDREVLEKAGAPFFSGRVSGRGRGLGLSRAMRWCEINGGTLELESTPGKGTRVWIKFPVSPESHD